MSERRPGCIRGSDGGAIELVVGARSHSGQQRQRLLDKTWAIERNIDSPWKRPCDSIRSACAPAATADQDP